MSSVEKTVVMLFTNKRSSSYQMPNSLKLYGQEIPLSETAKYLGVTLDMDMLLKKDVGQSANHATSNTPWVSG
jgi:hypothetical protein